MHGREEAIVIGSGVGGLASGIRLALKGYAVTVYEAGDGPGGKLSELRLGGYRFDRGPSLFTRPGLVAELFQEAGVPMEGRFAWRKLEEANRYFWEDGTRVRGWSDADRLAEELFRQLGVDPALVKRHLRRADELLQATGRTFLEHSLHRWDDLREGNVWEALTAARPGELLGSLHAINRRALDGHDKAVQLFDRFATYNGSDPYRTPGLMRMIPGLEHGEGAFFPVGGMYAITTALHGLAEDLGVRFQFGSPVERILLADDQRSVRGVRVNGTDHFAKVVVSNMDVVPTYRKLLPDLPAPERTLQQERSSSALVFYWGVQAQLPELGLHNILFSNDYRTEFDHLFGRLQVYHDPTVYIHISSVLEPGDAPPGCSNWFTMINAPRDVGQYDADTIARARRDVLAKVRRTLGVDVEPLIAVEEVLDPPTIGARTSSHQGSLYGTSSNSPWAAFLRHPNFHRRVQGLHFCGGSVHPGGGIPLALLSARIAVKGIGTVGPAPVLEQLRNTVTA